MAYSYVILNGDGSTTNFNFTFGYLDKSHIHVKVNGVEVSYTWVSDFQIKVTPAPASGAKVEIRRITPLTNVPVDYTDGSTLLEADLDLEATFNLYIAQENADAAAASITQNSLGLWDGKGRATTNFIDAPSDPTSLVTKGYLDTNYVPAIQAAVAAAQASATAAATSEANADASEAGAATSLDSFKKQYQGALASAPSTRYDGSALQAGDLYFNTTTSMMMVWSATSGWVSAGSAISSFISKPVTPLIATAGQTTFPVAGGYDANFILVFLNGLEVAPPDVNLTSGTNIVFTTPLTAGDEVMYVGFGSFNVANTYTQAQINSATDPSMGANLVGLDGDTNVRTWLLADGRNVATYAAARLYAGAATKINVLGRLAANDGGEGTFYYDPTDTTSTDNGGTILVGAGGKRWKRSFTGRVNIRWFGAVGDGVTACSTAIQAAINSLNTTGGTVYIPTGVWLIDAQITISRGGITIEGEGWEAFKGAWASTIPQVRGNGSWFYWTNTAINPFVFQASAANMVTFRRVGFDQPKNTIAPGWTPQGFDYCIRVNAGDALIEDIMFFGCNKGIAIGNTGAATGRTKLRRIFGEFFNVGVSIFYAADVVTITDYHQYPFWSAFTANVKSYAVANTWGIYSARNDNPQFNNIFIGGVNRGLYLSGTADGVTNKFMISNYDCDFSVTGVLIDGSGTTGCFSNYQSQPGPDTSLTNSRGVYINTNNCNIMMNNVRIARTNAELVNVNGTNNIVSLNNFDCQYWDDAVSNTITGITSSSSSNKIKLSGLVNFGPRTTTAAPLGGVLASYDWDSVLKGNVNGTTDASGQLTITHNLGFTPNRAIVTSQSNFQYFMSVVSKTSTTVVVKVWTSTGAATSIGAAFDYELKM